MQDLSRRKEKKDNRKAVKSGRCGFTLIELLITIAIIGILASIIFVSLTSVRKKATFASFKSSMSSVVAAATICRNEGGEIIDSDVSDSEICDDTLISDSIYPTISSGCADAGIFDAIEGSEDGWTIVQKCITGECEATCSAEGCVFSGGC